MPSILGANTLSSGFDVDNSLRFNDGDTAFLNKTFSGDGTHHDKGTVSVWLKRGELSSEQGIFIAGSSARHFIRIETGDTLTFRATTDSFHVQTNQLFRDPSAWYHIVVAYDTSQGTGSNRVKMYVNGSQVTSFSQTDYPDQNLDIKLGAAELNRIGSDSEQNNPYWDGYMCEFVYIDGTQLAADSFGEFDEDSGIWKPIDVSDLTFGTNGFYLQFKETGTSQNSSGLGADTSGNDHHFAVNNLAATDQTTDTCTNNFCTMNPLANKVTSVTFSEGNLKIDFANGRGGSTSTFGLTTGKWYVEYNITTMPVDERFHFGIVPREIQDADDIINTNNQGTAISGYNAAIYADSGSGSAILNNFYGNNTTRFDSFTGIIGMALDITNGTITFSKAGAWVTGSNTTDTDFSNALKVDISTPLARHDVWHIACGTGNSTGTSGVFSMNFGNPAFSISSGNADGNGYGNFEYAVPSGYYSLCTKNLAEYG